MKLPFLTLCVGFSLLLFSSPLWARDYVGGYKKPKICLESNIRCVLKKAGNTLYWCLKSSIQRNLDTRRSSSPIRRTLRDNMGHCAKVIPIDDYKKE